MKDVTTGDTLSAGVPRELFRTTNAGGYDVSADGQRFLLPAPSANEDVDAPITVGHDDRLARLVVVARGVGNRQRELRADLADLDAIGVGRTAAIELIRDLYGEHAVVRNRHAQPKLGNYENATLKIEGA